MRPVLARLGPLAINSYGAMLMLGVIAAAVVALTRARRHGTRRDDVLALAALALGGGLLGGYLLFQVTQLPALWRDPSLFWRSTGMVFYGGLLGAAGAIAAYAAFVKIPLGAAADLVAPAVPVGQALGRVGCLLAGCCHGRPAEGAWAEPFGGRHPVQLYEAAGLLALAAGLLLLERRRPRPFTVALAYLAGYAVLRFGLELLRGDAIRGFVLGGALSTSQLLSLLIGGAAVVLLLARRGGRTITGPGAAQPPFDPAAKPR
ncbi:MAG TPA: prolipoprotein diacylglyceryl transferase family protein [Polyangia bacterium]|jgi:phosphatidylglycerol:prolipoprotein diacylglycerol transferase